MRKNFNSVQMLETSEVCNKISKSVSHETLVGGTATTGREYEQNQRLCECGAHKPLTAVGTLTSLLCNSAKVIVKLLRHVITRRTSVRRGYLPEQGTHANKESLFASVTCFMRLPRRIQRMLLVMTIPVLTLIFTLITTSKSQAIEIPTGGVSGTCNSAGTCLWNLDENGKMTISAADKAKEVKMDNYFCSGDNCDFGGGDRPWENYLQDIKNVVVGDNITYIGSDAFQAAHNLETVTGMKDVTTIGNNGVFSWATSLKSIEMPNVTHVGYSTFLYATSLESVDMPKVTSIENEAFLGATALQYVGLAVDEKGNPLNVNIADDAFVETNSAVINCTNANRSACGSCGNGYVMSGLGCVSDCGTGYLGKEGRCIDASNGCGEGYRQFENFCNRIQYTPAEAAKVLTDDNNNSVTITFKK